MATQLPKAKAKPKGKGKGRGRNKKEEPPPLEPNFEHRPWHDEEIKRAFDTFDLDQNRFVGAAELGHIMQLIGDELSFEEIDEMIRMCDTDGDGQVTFDEFYRLMTGPPPPLPEMPKKEKKHRPKAVRDALALQIAQQKAAALAQFEADRQREAELARCRAVSVETLVRKLSGGLKRVKPSQIKDIYKRFQEIDIDQSGAIDYHEFCIALEMEDSSVAQQMFRVFDMDGGGQVELKEFIVVLSRFTSADQSEKMKFAFMMFDEDGSGYIDRDELIDMLAASFVIEGQSRDELEARADMVYDFIHVPIGEPISYDDFMRVAGSGLIYPVVEE